MIVKLLTEHHLEFLSLKGGCRGLSKCQIVGNLMSWLICGSHLGMVCFSIKSTRPFQYDKSLKGTNTSQH